MDPRNTKLLGDRASINANLSVWKEELATDKDRVFLLDGLAKGFRIIDLNQTIQEVEQVNHKSSLKHREAVEKELVDQISNGYYILSSQKPTVVSALAAILKEDGGVRLIHDGSRPVGFAMNDYSDPESVKFQTLADACHLAKPGYWCAKVDLKSAYRSVCIHPDNYQVTGLKWTFQGQQEPTYFFDSRLPFGSNVGPSTFHRISQAVRRCMIRRGFSGTVVYIDDFFLAAKTKEECMQMLLTLIRLLRRLGFYISWPKVVGPTQTITFLGVQICTLTSTLSLSEDKLQQLRQRLQHFQGKRRATKQSLQSLAGSLNWACQAVKGGKFFLKRILDTIRPLKQQRHKARLSAEFHADLQWWLSYMHVFNGVVYFNQQSNEHVHVDASNMAAGAFWNGDWQYTVFAVDMPAAYKLHINYKEVCAVVQAVSRWAPYWKGKHVVVHTDSTVTKAIINKGRSRNSYVNSLLRKMAWVCAKMNCSVSAVHVAGSVNLFADSISRLHEGRLGMLGQLLTNWYRGRPPAYHMWDHMSLPAFAFLLSRCGPQLEGSTSSRSGRLPR